MNFARKSTSWMMGLEAETESLEASTYKSYFDLVASGHGSEETVASAAAYAIGVYQQKMAEIEAQRKAEIAISDERQAEAKANGASKEELDAADVARAERQAEFDREEAVLRTEYQANVAALMDGLALRDKETSQYITEGGRVLEGMSSLAYAAASGSYYDKEDWLRQNLTPEMMARYSDYGTQYGLNGWWNDWSQVQAYIADPESLPMGQWEAAFSAIQAGYRADYEQWLDSKTPDGMVDINALIAQAFDGSVENVDAGIPACGVLLEGGADRRGCRGVLADDGFDHHGQARDGGGEGSEGRLGCVGGRIRRGNGAGRHGKGAGRRSSVGHGNLCVRNAGRLYGACRPLRGLATAAVRLVVLLMNAGDFGIQLFLGIGGCPLVDGFPLFVATEIDAGAKSFCHDAPPIRGI